MPISAMLNVRRTCKRGHCHQLDQIPISPNSHKNHHHPLIADRRAGDKDARSRQSLLPAPPRFPRQFCSWATATPNGSPSRRRTGDGAGKAKVRRRSARSRNPLSPFTSRAGQRTREHDRHLFKSRRHLRQSNSPSKTAPSLAQVTAGERIMAVLEKACEAPRRALPYAPAGGTDEDPNADGDPKHQERALLRLIG